MKEDRKKELMEKIASYIPEGEASRRNFIPLYTEKETMDKVLAFWAEPFRGQVDYVVSPETLGFIPGSMLARELGVGFIALRKGEDHFPEGTEVLKAPYIDHRNQVQCLVGMKELLPAGAKVLIVDDYIETAATIQSCMAILEDAGAHISGIAALGVCYRSVTKEMIDSGQIRYIHCISAEE